MRSNAMIAHTAAFVFAASVQRRAAALAGCIFLLLARARIEATFSTGIIRGVCVPLDYDGCQNVSLSLCNERRCDTRLIQELHSTSMSAESQWVLGYEVCGGTTCEWVRDVPLCIRILYGPMGVLPCLAAFFLGALVRSPGVAAYALWVLGALCVAWLDARFVIDDLFRGDPVTTMWLSLTGVLQQHHVEASPHVRMLAMCPHIIYILQAAVPRVDVAPYRRMLCIIGAFRMRSARAVWHVLVVAWPALTWHLMLRWFGVTASGFPDILLVYSVLH